MAIDPITGIEEVAGGLITLINKFVPDKNVQEQIIAQAQHDKETYAEQQLAAQKDQYIADIELLKAQAATNTIEAGNSNLFVSGWRAFAGWAFTLLIVVCVIGLLVLYFQGKPVDGFLSILSIPMTPLLGMLGLHTVERWHGVAPDQSPSGEPTPSPVPRAILVKK